MESKDMVFIRELVRDGRISLRDLAEKTGLSYTSVRERLYRLRERGLISFKPMVSPRLYGRVAAVVEARGENLSSLAEDMSLCNRVLFVMTSRDGRGEKIVAALVASSTAEIIVTLEHFFRKRGIQEYSISYGRIPGNLYIPLKCSTPRCIECSADDKIKALCRGCLPRPRIKG